METSTTVYCIVALFAAIIGCYIFAVKLVAKLGEKIVYKDVCEKTQDCIEVELKNHNEKIDKLEVKMDGHFEKIQCLIIENGKS